MKKDYSISLNNPGQGLLKHMSIHSDRYRTYHFAFLSPRRERAGFTLLELIIATSILSIIALLIYPAYRASSRSYQLSVVQSNLQQNARIGMKKMVSLPFLFPVLSPSSSSQCGHFAVGLIALHLIDRSGS